MSSERNFGKEDERDENVPDDFPRVRITGAIPGIQPKFLATLYDGRYYLSGCTPPEVFERWCICKDLVAQLYAKSLETKIGKRAHMTEESILDQYYNRLVETRWTSVAESRWIMQRVAELLGWNVSGSSWTREM